MLEPRATEAGLAVTIRKEGEIPGSRSWVWWGKPCLDHIQLRPNALNPKRYLPATKEDVAAAGGWSLRARTAHCVVVKQFIVGRVPDGFVVDEPLKLQPNMVYEVYVDEIRNDGMGTTSIVARADGRGGIRLEPRRP